ncbi:isocitrate lyase/phosphoenolpyruvate mutase family protein [Dactylosporangium sp. NPDC050688]|uniref:isocitrate lyase/PEP mutase family protein n=1 Tax=Dactylosporangium sp. NPDC050688 TaxID=3157217 RepID=UPI003409550F
MLRALLDPATGPLLLAGAPNALAARVVEEQGFQAVYVTGAGISNTFLAVPDVGLLTVSELTAHVEAIAESVSIPIVVDADTGFGNPINVRRTVRQLERAGASAIQIEDQITPKRCGHFEGKEVISADEMTAKIKAAVDARVNDDLVIIARTDARAVRGLSEACERAAQYREAGADVLFVEAPRSLEEMRYITSQVPGLHLANMVEGGLTPILSRDQLRDLNYAAVLYANSAMRASVQAMRAVLAHLNEYGDTKGVEDLMIGWNDRQALVGKDVYDELDRRYSVGEHTSGQR